jgi:hypothetical protein
MENRKYLLIAFVLVISATLFLLLKNTPTTTDTRKEQIPNEYKVYVEVKSATKKEIAYAITNDSEKDIYLWPNTCASSTVELYEYKGEKRIGPQIVCMMAPQPVILRARSSENGIQSLEGLSNRLNYSNYILKLSFSYKNESYQLVDTKTVSSSEFS